MKERTCCDCGETKPLAEFRKRAKPRLGYLSYCVLCLRARWRRWAYGSVANG